MRKKKPFNKLAKIEAEMARLEGMASQVYFNPDMTHPRSGTPAPDVAAINYYGDSAGLGRPPARPFMDVMQVLAYGEIAKILRKGVKDVARGKLTAGQVYRLVGNAQKRHLYSVLRNGGAYFLPNAEETLRQKGADKQPLEETGTFLIRAIKTQVTKK